MKTHPDTYLLLQKHPLDETLTEPDSRLPASLVHVTEGYAPNGGWEDALRGMGALEYPDS